MGSTTKGLATKLRVKPQTIRARLSKTGSYFGETPHTLPNGRLWWEDGAFERITFARVVTTLRVMEEAAYAEDSCDDCGVSPGELHVPGCDIEPCPTCGGQILYCSCEDDPSMPRVPWTGEWPGTADCRLYGLLLPDGEPDLGRLETTCYWNQETQRWGRPS